MADESKRKDDPTCFCGHRRSLHSRQDAVCEVNGCEGCYEHHDAPEAYKVLRVERSEEDGSGGYEVFLSPIYYGPDEEGPKVGEVLVPGKPR